MKKRILQTSIQLNLILLLLVGQSCQNGNATPENSSVVGKTDSTQTTIKESNLSKEAAQLVGTWNFGQEPVAYDFNADGTFREYSPEGAMDPEAAELVYNQGTWEIKDGKLLLHQSEKTENIELHWLKEDAIFLGDLEREYSVEHGTKEEFAAEMGWVREP